MKSPKGQARKAYRALRRGGFGRRMAKVGANNVGKAQRVANKKSKRMKYRGKRRYRRMRRRRY